MKNYITMENYENENPITGDQTEMEKDEIINPEQFQVGRAAENDKSEEDDAEYTPEESQFADGKGTQLAEEFETSDSETPEVEEQNDTEEDLD